MAFPSKIGSFVFPACKPEQLMAHLFWTHIYVCTLGIIAVPIYSIVPAELGVKLLTTGLSGVPTRFRRRRTPPSTPGKR